jgi:dihydroflavonol-4-reductase
MREPMTGVDGVFHIAVWFYIGPGPQEAKKAERINVGGTRMDGWHAGTSLESDR